MADIFPTAFLIDQTDTNNLDSQINEIPPQNTHTRQNLDKQYKQPKSTILAQTLPISSEPSMMAMISSANSYAFASPKLLKKCYKLNVIKTRQFSFFTVRASSDESDDCNEEECAPDKEVGKVSMEWLAGDNTRVVGTFPPRKKGWTGYVEKDTAGQTNIYSVEPAVYVAESAISSGTAGSAADGSENTIAIAAGLGLVCVAAASFILLQVGKNSPPVQTVEYNGPALSYYINKFKPAEVIQAAAPSPADSSSQSTTS